MCDRVAEPQGSAFTGTALRLRLKENFHQFNFKFHKEKEMVTFRKSILLLAVIAMTATVASAQLGPPPAFACVATGGVPPLVRAEGLAELVGDLVLNCTGGIPTAQNVTVPKVNIRIFVNTNVTSWLVGGGTTSEALLLIDDPQPDDQMVCRAGQVCDVTGVGGEPGVDYSQTYNVWEGIQVDTNQIEWRGVAVDPPGTRSSRVIRITNVRANAFQLGAGGLIPSEVSALISITGAASIPVNDPQQTVAWVREGLDFSAQGSTHLQCEAPHDMSSVTFSEKFVTAFKERGGVQPIPGSFLNTETGLYNPTQIGSHGRATHGTRLLARFTDIPAGVSLSVSRGASDNGTVAAYVSGADSNGNGGTPGSTSGMVGIGGSSGTAYAVWEVVQSDQNTLDELTFDVSFSWAVNTQAGVPGLGSGNVAGSYAPLSNINTATTQDIQPRFVDDSSEMTIITINSCMTNLLFPYVTNEAGFDTGLVIANTSLDPFGTAPQEGPCKIYYYGNVAGGPGTSTANTPSVAGGEYAVWTLSSGGGVRTESGTSGTIDPMPGFNGYVIARCEFQFAHGYAFISDLGAQKLAQGYLALVLDESVFNECTSCGQGDGGCCGKVGSRTGSKSEPLNQ